VFSTNNDKDTSHGLEKIGFSFDKKNLQKSIMFIDNKIPCLLVFSKTMATPMQAWNPCGVE
jgi:hypothetical protein